MILFLLLFSVFGMVLLSVYIKRSEGKPKSSFNTERVNSPRMRSATSSFVAGSLLSNVDNNHHTSQSSGDLKVTEINPATGITMHGGIDEAGFHYGESPIDSGISGDDFSFSDTSTPIDDNI